MPIEVPDFDLYATLEVDPRASAEVITASWKVLQKRHYPRAPGQGDADLSRRLNIAHEWLVDPVLRARYDATRAAATSFVRAAAAPTPASRPASPPGRPPRPAASGPEPRPSAGASTAGSPPRPTGSTGSAGTAEPRPPVDPIGFARLLRFPTWGRKIAVLVGLYAFASLAFGIGFRFGANGVTIAAILTIGAIGAGISVADSTRGFDRDELVRAPLGRKRVVSFLVWCGISSPVLVGIVLMPQQILADAVRLGFTGLGVLLAALVFLGLVAGALVRR